MARQPDPPVSPRDDEVTVSVIREALSVKRRVVDTAQFRVRKVVDERNVELDEPIVEQRVRIERVRIDRPVEHAPQHRIEGDTLIVPVIEERLASEKRLFVKEEIRIERRELERRMRHPVVLRCERVIVERQDEPGGPWREIEPEPAPEGAGASGPPATP